jgi:hypothetical protein
MKNLTKFEVEEIVTSAKEHSSFWKTPVNTELIKSDFTVDTSHLTPWTDEQSQVLLSAAILEAETIKLISSQTGVKYIDSLKYLGDGNPLNGVNAIFQAYQHGWHPVGTTVPTNRNVSVSKIMTQEELYPEDLNNFSYQLSATPGFQTTLPFEQLYGELKAKQIAKNIELMIWGTQTGATDGTNACTGLGYLLPSVAFGAQTTGCTKLQFDWVANLTGMTSSDWINLVNNAINDLPEEIQGMNDLTLFMGHSKFRAMLKALIIGNLYHIDVTNEKGLTSIIFPGTNVKIVAVNGLNNQNYCVLTPAFNLVLLTDLMNEWEKFTLIWNPYDLMGQFYAYMKIGIDAYFYNYICYIAA